MADLATLVAGTQATLERIARDFSPATFASSLAAEDMVLTDLILKARLPIAIFSLETGRLHKETLAMLDGVKAHLAQDALAREVEAWSKAGHPEEAYQRARQYVSQYPQGRRLHAVQLYGGLRAP